MSGPIVPVTAEALRRCSLRQVAFIDLARGGSIVVQACDAFPRLTRRLSRDRRGAPVRISFLVDGVPCRDLDDAVAALNGPVIPQDLFERAAP